MIEVTFPVSVSIGWWSGDNDISIYVAEDEFETLQQAIADAEAEGWCYLDEDGPCAGLFPRIKDAILESLEEADLELDLDDLEFAVHLPEE